MSSQKSQKSQKWVRVVPGVAVASVVQVALAGVGGGIAGAGLEGEYFASPDLSGKPAFVRRDVRVAFDWSEKLPVGGSTAEVYKSFPRQNYSVRWTGQIIPRFSESYTFAVTADDGVRVKLRKGGETAWNTVVEQWQNAGGKALKSKPVTLESGTKYDIVIEYRESTGKAACSLRWSSPSTPEEVIDPVYDSGLNLASFDGYCLANKAKEGRYWRVNGGEPKPELLDERGWPKYDCEFILSEGHKSVKGTYLISFGGKAAIECALFRGKFTVGEKTFEGKLPAGEGYDAKANRTSVLLDIPVEEGSAWLKFQQTSRDGSETTNTGITDLRLMRPTEYGSSQPHAADEVVYRPMKAALNAYTMIRWLQVANVNAPGEWDARTLPTNMKFDTEKGGENWEHLIMIANETGRDLYLCTPVLADNDYLRKLALLCKYGSDGKEPYTSEQTNPVYPPLNPNLRVYVEIGNEIWNWAFGSTQQCRTQAEKEIKEGTEDGKIAAAVGGGNYRTWHAVRTVRASNIFRDVFGDAAMGSRIRMLVEYQYANAQETAYHSFRLIDGYFNNGAGDFVQNPKPVSYYIWGAGGAAYYGVGNGEGTQDEIKVPDGSFEATAVEDGTVKPAEGAWTFSGGAGIYRNLSSAASEFVPGKKMRAGKGMAVGMRFKTGAKPLYVYQLGQNFDSGSQGAILQIVDVATKKVLAEVKRGEVAAYMTKIFGYYYAERLKEPVELAPNTEYYLISQMIGDQQVLNGQTTVKPGEELQILSAVQVRAGGEWKAEENGTANTCYGPLNFLYSTKKDIAPTLPQPPFGQQAAVIQGDGEFTGTIDFPKDGTYALNLNAFVSPGYKTSFQVFVDNEPIGPRDQSDFRPGKSFAIGGWGRNNGIKEQWGSVPFAVKAGKHTIRFVGKGPKELFSAFDNLEIASADAIMTSGFGAGSALGQPVENAWGANQTKDSALALAFGLPRVSYETGWSLGGDFYQKPIQNWCKLMDPRAEGINDKALEIMQSGGMVIPVWGVYTYWPVWDFKGSATYPIMKSTITAGSRLPAEMTNGTVVPAELKPEMSTEWHWNGKNPKLDKRGQWRSWTFVTDKAGEITITPTATGGGSYDLEVDGKPAGKLATAGGAGTPVKVWVTQGSHGLRLRNMGGTVVVEKVAVTK